MLTKDSAKVCNKKELKLQEIGAINWSENLESWGIWKQCIKGVISNTISQKLKLTITQAMQKPQYKNDKNQNTKMTRKNL